MIIKFYIIQNKSFALINDMKSFFLHEHPTDPKWSFEQIAKYIHCSKSVAAYWVKKYHENRNLNTQKDIVSHPTACHQFSRFYEMLYC